MLGRWDAGTLESAESTALRAEEQPEEEQSDEPEFGEGEGLPTGVRNILPLGDSITEGVPFTYRHSLYTKLTQANYAFDFVGSHTNGAGGYPENGWDRDNEGWAGWTTESIQEELSALPAWTQNPME